MTGGQSDRPSPCKYALVGCEQFVKTSGTELSPDSLPCDSRESLHWAAWDTEEHCKTWNHTVHPCERRSLLTKVGGDHGEDHAAPPITPEGGGLNVGFRISGRRHNESLLPRAGDGELLHLCKAGSPTCSWVFLEGSRGT